MAKENKIPFLKKSSFKCISFSEPGDSLKIKMSINEDDEDEDTVSPRLETLSTDRKPGKFVQQVIALNVGIWKEKDKKAVIHFIELGVVSKSLAE